MTSSTAQRDMPKATGTAAGWTRTDLVLAALVVLMACAVYLNTLQGDFVYDDRWQILRNEYVLRNDLIGEALISDVWEFRRGGEVGSSYWRPVFVLWLIANQRVFGFEAAGWHVTSILLHALATLLAFGLARAMVERSIPAGAAAALFAVHPVHVESVAWISGCTDILLAIGIFASLWSYLRWRDTKSIAMYSMSLVFAAMAMLSKEPGVTAPALIMVAAWMTDRTSTSTAKRAGRALMQAVPFALLALLYLLGRRLVLGGHAAGPGPVESLVIAALNMLPVSAFYLRQLAMPIEIGPSYPMRMLTTSSFTIAPLVVGALAVAAMAAVSWWLVRRNRMLLLATGLLVLPLLPALHVAALPDPHQIVHDRYLYVPLLGFAMLVVTLLLIVFGRWAKLDRRRAEAATLITVLVLCVPAALQTWRYNRAWTAELPLWRWAVRVDPESALNHNQLGVWLHDDAMTARQQGNIEQSDALLHEALQHFDQSLSLAMLRNAYLGRAEVLLALGRFAEAEADLREVLDRNPADFDAHDRLAVLFQRQGRLRDAESVLREARSAIPHRYCTLSDKLAIVLYQQRRLQAAMHELELARPRVSDERSPDASLVLYRLGMLYQEMGRPAEARDVLAEFLARSVRYQGDAMRAFREQAHAIVDDAD